MTGREGSWAAECTVCEPCTSLLLRRKTDYCVTFMWLKIAEHLEIYTSMLNATNRNALWGTCALDITENGKRARPNLSQPQLRMESFLLLEDLTDTSYAIFGSFLNIWSM